MNRLRLESLCARDPRSDQDGYGTHTPPLHLSSTFIYPSPEEAVEIFREERHAHIYSRWHNPTVDLVEAKIAQIEGRGLDQTPWSLLFSTGMAAITHAILACCKQGERVITHANIYGTSSELFTQHFADFGIETQFIDPEDDRALQEALAPAESTVLYIETPNNPTLRCYDLEVMAQFAQENGAVLIVDGTFASPYFQQALHYADLSIHSTTKFMNGHGNALGGCVSGLDQDLRSKVWKKRKVMGGILPPFDAWLLSQGLKTLHIRMRQHEENAMAVARFLADHPKVSAVHYPGLPEHSHHPIAKKQMSGFGAVLSFELEGGYDAAFAMLKRCKLCTLTATLGTTDTLIQHPASMTHVQVPRELRLAGGITDGMLRLAIGLEHVDDILADLKQAIDG